MILFGMLVAVSGCRMRDRTGPPDIRYGQEPCAQCRMIIQDERYAAALNDRGEVLRFDDIGCLRAHEWRNAVSRSADRWVHDSAAGDWIRVDEAVFVQAPDLMTPMGYGVAAFKDHDEASAFASRQGGRVTGWDDIQTEDRI